MPLNYREIMERHTNPAHMMRKRKYDGANWGFDYEWREDAAASQKAGRKVEVPIEIIWIQFPGQDKTVRRVEKHDIEEYPEIYAAFKAAEGEKFDATLTGTSLQEWTVIPRTSAREFMNLGFYTVEQLAGATDDVKRKLGPLQKWCKDAKTWLEAANSDQNKTKSLLDENERQKARIEKLEEQNYLLMQRIEAVEGTRLHGASQHHN